MFKISFCFIRIPLNGSIITNYLCSKDVTQITVCYNLSHEAVPSGGARFSWEILKLYLLICIDLIFDSRVDGGMPSLAAAPNGPDTRPLASAKAAPSYGTSRMPGL